MVCFTARGEPLLDKRIVHYVKYAKELGISYVEFTSNAQLLNDTTARALIESGLDTDRFSMTGSVQEVYERWQGYKSNFVLRDAELNITRLAISSYYEI